MPLVALKRSMTSDPINWIEVDHLNAPKSVVKLGKTKDGYSYYNNVVWRWETEPYGSYPAQETMKFDYGYGRDGIATTTTFTMNLRFPGQIYDKETGTHYNVFRDYDPQTGRYLQADPIGLGGGMNRWGYVGGNPMGGVDPLGLDEAVLTNPGVTIGLVGICIANPLPCGAFVIGGACAAGYNYFFNQSDQESWPYAVTLGDGSKVGSTCPQNQFNYLNKQVEENCKVPKPNKCVENDTFQDLERKKDHFNRCLNTRKNREDTCFRGGDNGHLQQIVEISNGLNRCNKLINRSIK
jgi:RHS repeat-associated protein